MISKEDRLVISFIDNGCGMSEEFVAKVTDPFATTRSTRKVGLGLPLLKELCELTGQFSRTSVQTHRGPVQGVSVGYGDAGQDDGNICGDGHP